mgnify:CR=1 FL=1
MRNDELVDRAGAKFAILRAAYCRAQFCLPAGVTQSSMVVRPAGGICYRQSKGYQQLIKKTEHFQMYAGRIKLCCTAIL